jgi:hypothetical protein
MTLQPIFEAQIVILLTPELNAFIVTWLPEIDTLATEGLVLLVIDKLALTEAETTELCPADKMTDV